MAEQCIPYAYNVVEWGRMNWVWPFVLLAGIILTCPALGKVS